MSIKTNQTSLSKTRSFNSDVISVVIIIIIALGFASVSPGYVSAAEADATSVAEASRENDSVRTLLSLIDADGKSETHGGETPEQEPISSPAQDPAPDPAATEPAEQSEFIVYFDANGGKALTPASAKKMKAVFDVALGKLPVPDRKYYRFTGWFDKKKGGLEYTEISTLPKRADLTLYAHWEVLRYTIEFKTNGGKNLSASDRTKEVRADRLIGDMPIPKRSGRYFAGWFTKKSGGKQLYTISSLKKSQTLYAHWSKRPPQNRGAVKYAVKTGDYSGLKGTNKKIAKKIYKVIKKSIRPGMSKALKAKAIHDWLVLNTAYDYKNYLKRSIPMISHTAGGPLLRGKAVCDGYSTAYLQIMNTLGVPCKIAHGRNHAWNLVKLDGKYYHVDVTWDDPVPDEKGRIQYNYFLVSDKTATRGNPNHRAYGCKTSYVQDHPEFKKYIKKTNSYNRTSNPSLP
jgi:uncharacterized repeat protein (TIGR02543 family)